MNQSPWIFPEHVSWHFETASTDTDICIPWSLRTHRISGQLQINYWAVWRQDKRGSLMAAFTCLFFAYCNLFFMYSVPPDSTAYVNTALAYFCCCPETKSQKTQTVFKGNEGRRCFTPVHSKSSGTWKNRRLLLKGTYPGLTGTITGSPSLLRLLSIPLRRSCWTRKLFKKGILASAQLNIEIDVWTDIWR